MVPLVERIKVEIKEALRSFGEYTFGDKGCEEVMDMDTLEEEMRKCTPSMAALVITTLAGGNEYEEQVASGLMYRLQDWDELFEEPSMGAVEL